jgi:hypothetical protein
LLDGDCALGEGTAPVQLLDQAVELGGAARHRLAGALACDLADALKGTVG